MNLQDFMKYTFFHDIFKNPKIKISWNNLCVWKFKHFHEMNKHLQEIQKSHEMKI